MVQVLELALEPRCEAREDADADANVSASCSGSPSERDRWRWSRRARRAQDLERVTLLELHSDALL